MRFGATAATTTTITTTTRNTTKTTTTLRPDNDPMRFGYAMLNDTSTLRAAVIPAAAPDRGFGRFVTVRTGIPRSTSERLLRGVGWNAAGCLIGQRSEEHTSELQSPM